ncbi:MAG: acyl-CoA thioesterase [Candidatus Marsarchaeota archaeon]|jgi:acyl-CoA thioester hydrolase|uniref:Thioesterase superfamily protein n=1 Tax=Candidatus Micrarchaeum acidiphilum ARMAN-2 TaxID=425595 RepID=C7DIB9_MICA2|nr:MAG: thioesterase superfamily protein [Candidatus Micrarchaeum acidiphilum ARMAN-2]MCL5680364.1 acyl-CoA thioesterase [Candidatus Marsarchaeota archaeon]MCW6160944.1 acyl-CoA thioesterase [Candidatus Micrarchaeales archaeon]
MKFKVKETVHVYDTDYQGIAHYAAYYRFFTDCIEAFQKQILGQKKPNFSKGSVWFVVGESNAHYNRPVRAGDTLEVSLDVALVSPSVIKYAFEIKNLTTREISTYGYLKMVAINPRTWKATNVPQNIAKKINQGR